MVEKRRSVSVRKNELNSKDITEKIDAFIQMPKKRPDGRKKNIRAHIQNK